jgi:DNA-binding transcriptional LysR family regulator
MRVRLLTSPHLAAFLAVVERGSMSRAAEGLHLTQSAVSKRVRALEVALGVELIDRTVKPLRPTRAGERVVAYGVETRAAQERLLAALHQGIVESAPPVPLDAADAAASTADRLREVLRAARVGRVVPDAEES